MKHVHNTYGGSLKRQAVLCREYENWLSVALKECEKLVSDNASSQITQYRQKASQVASLMEEIRKAFQLVRMVSKGVLGMAVQAHALVS